MTNEETLASKNEACSNPVRNDDQQNGQELVDNDGRVNSSLNHSIAQANEEKTSKVSGVAPPIEPEVSEVIQVGAGGKLEVPREDIDLDLDDGAELDLANLQAIKIRKPGRREWIAINLGLELPVRMLLHKPRPDAIDTEYFYVDKALRGLIHDELKEVRVFPYYSLKPKSFALWIINVTLENSWYESLAQLLKQPPEFFRNHAIRVISDKPNGRYRARFKPMPCEIIWPTENTGKLLAEALGSGHMISSADHPFYRELIEGTEL